MTQIIAFAGKKQSGKNTCCNFITMLKLIESGVCKKARLSDSGDIEVSDVFGETTDEEYFPFKEPYVNVDAVLEQMRSVKIYALADPLKRIAIDVFGLPEDKVYGTDDDKNELTHLLWENMPGMYTETDKGLLGLVKYHEPGPMTIREFLQYLGTDIFRKMFSDVWINALLSRIEKDSPDIALVCDVRFDNEIKLLKEKGALVVGLKRDLFKSKDQHSSEKVNLSLCHQTINNQDLDIPELNKEVYFALKDLDCKNLTDLGV